MPYPGCYGAVPVTSNPPADRPECRFFQQVTLGTRGASRAPVIEGRVDTRSRTRFAAGQN